MKYFVFNKPMDYKRGYVKGCVCTQHGIQLSEGSERGVFFSKVLDSGEKEMQWHRMTCEIPVLRTGIHFWLYCSDTEEVIYNGNKADIEEVLLSDIESEEKRRICQKRHDFKSTGAQKRCNGARRNDPKRTSLLQHRYPAKNR